MTYAHLDSLSFQLLVDHMPPTIEERIEAMRVRREARFQEDWLIAIGINALWDLKTEVPDGRG